MVELHGRIRTKCLDIEHQVHKYKIILKCFVSDFEVNYEYFILTNNSYKNVSLIEQLTALQV